MQRFAAELRRLRITAGEPQIKTIAARAQCSPATVSEVLNGRRLASESVIRRLVDALGGDWGRWRQLWREAKTELDALQRGVPDVRREPGTSGAVPDLGRVLAGSSRVEMVCYPDPPAFYRAAADGIRAARREIRLTYVRLHPPGQWGAAEASAYYDTVLQWARDHSAECGSVRRIIGVPEHGGVPKAASLQWLKEHQAEARDVYAYEARVMPWSAACAWHNMGVMDDSATYLSFSGAGRQQLTGFRVEGARFAGYFTDSFDQAWGALEPLDAYLARHG
ncbi:helix-turn-helix domain-containing protein [Streptomyces echinoruber]|uniref:HTH cro/C1-type domain-containing protein n=1 Tax=Streptomyces echinoruber TaxID=68898 RepID=A0A918VG17_9ACTN|nr:helix-turn-helix transcriptional regulator [Streptomyces echinoruber]GGZ98255.1 hypothetical protein GCM10010389_41970 [Streptomyces echinoruber]